MTRRAPKSPHAVRIGGRSWPISYRREKAMGEAMGLCHYDKGRIDILAGQSPFDKRDTVLHETFHAILAQQGRTTFGNEEEEIYVRALATGLIGVLQDNPEFARWLINPISHKRESN